MGTNIRRTVIGSLPAISFKPHRLHSETAGLNGLGFVEVTLCHIGLSEISRIMYHLLSFLCIDPAYDIFLVKYSDQTLISY